MRLPWQKQRTGDIYAVVEEQRRLLLEGEQATVRHLLASYREAQRGIEAELNRVLARLLKAQTDGTEINQAWLFQHGRLSELLAEVEARIAKFSGKAEAITTAQQALNVIRATNATGAIMGAAGVKSGFVMLHRDAFEDVVGFLSDGSPLHKIFKDLSPDAVDAARRAFAHSMVLGRNPRVTGRIIQETVDDAVNMSRNRAVLIARTETMRAYRTATLRNYANNPGIVQGWRWLSGRDGRCCPICIAMDGSTHKLDEPFASHPGCRCSAVPVLAEGIDTDIGTGDEWLTGQDEETQLSVLGASRLKLWQDGDASLDDMVEDTFSNQWGAGKKLKPLRDLRN